eukprot:jgi/Ulvmu1/5768/UM025_0022.1
MEFGHACNTTFVTQRSACTARKKTNSTHSAYADIQDVHTVKRSPSHSRIGAAHSFTTKNTQQPGAAMVSRRPVECHACQHVMHASMGNLAQSRSVVFCVFAYVPALVRSGICSCGEWPWRLRWSALHMSVCLHVDWSVASALLGPRAITVQHRAGATAKQCCEQEAELLLHGLHGDQRRR